MCFENGEEVERNWHALLGFEVKWLKEAHFHQVVEDAYEHARTRSPTDSLAKLAPVHDLLRKWDRTVLHQKRRFFLLVLRRRWKKLVSGPVDDETIHQQRKLPKEIEDLLENEAIHWSQRSRVKWLHHGDKNTPYFHKFASERRMKNRIKGQEMEMPAGLKVALI
jgi:hypothetical protein